MFHCPHVAPPTTNVTYQGCSVYRNDPSCQPASHPRKCTPFAQRLGNPLEKEAPILSRMRVSRATARRQIVDVLAHGTRELLEARL